MTTASECEVHEYHWYLDEPNEQGWRCCACQCKPGEPPGYSPHLDREEIERKVYGILSDLCMAKVAYVSNSSHGDGIVGAVTAWCRETDTYDQASIVAEITRGLAGDGKFWRELGQAIVDGKDPRPRCWCGTLGRIWDGRYPDRSFCSIEHKPGNPGVNEDLPF